MTTLGGSLYESLAWLPAPPADFAAQCKSLAGWEEGCGNRVRFLATHALDENGLQRLSRAIRKLVTSGRNLQPLTPFKLGVLSNSTLDFVIPSLTASAARHGILLEVIPGDYGQVAQEALNPDSRLNRARPDAVLLALDERAVPIKSRPGNVAEAAEAVDRYVSYVQNLQAGIAANSQAICILQSLAPAPEWLFGSLDAVLPGARQYVAARINARLAEMTLESSSVLLDVAGFASTVGLANWHSPVQWNLAKLPFSNSYLPLYADQVGRLLAAIRGKSRKCLVLDLDNTVWSGIVGDDGLYGIKIGEGDPTGEAHLSVQRLALDLRERGVVLAVSSKNNDDVARQPFQEHPEMLLRENHIAVFQANWNDKATNIQVIADELSLGVDAMVLLDDNPVERDLVRSLLPQVAVPELPADPALYARTLAAAGYFESVAFSEEDTKRAGFYQDNARRVTLQKQVGDLDAYLLSLQMEITFQPFDLTGRSRITQLINKSNQFNLTTKRYTEAEVAAAEADPGCYTLQVRLADSFGDNGIISIIVCRAVEPDAWLFDTWLMSCRVLGRRVQNAVLKQVVEHASERGVKTLLGVYRPTGKNKLVQDHYSSLGFTQTKADPDGTTFWELDVDSARIERAPMTVRLVGFDFAERIYPVHA